MSTYWYGPWVDATHHHLMTGRDATAKLVARERYYLRHRLVRLLRRVYRHKAWLAAVARVLACTMNTPDRRWFSLDPGFAPPAGNVRLVGQGMASPWFGVDLAQPASDVTVGARFVRGDGHVMRFDGYEVYDETCEISQEQWYALKDRLARERLTLPTAAELRGEMTLYGRSVRVENRKLRSAVWPSRVWSVPELVKNYGFSPHLVSGCYSLNNEQCPHDPHEPPRTQLIDLFGLPSRAPTSPHFNPPSPTSPTTLGRWGRWGRGGEGGEIPFEKTRISLQVEKCYR